MLLLKSNPFEIEIETRLLSPCLALYFEIYTIISISFDLKKYCFYMLMSVEPNSVKQCSRCRCTLLLDQYFEKNRKGEYFKLCNSCRGRGRTENEQFREKHYNEYRVCDKCGNNYSVNGGRSTHQRTWYCFKKQLGRESNDDDF